MCVTVTHSSQVSHWKNKITKTKQDQVCNYPHPLCFHEIYVAPWGWILSNPLQVQNYLHPLCFSAKSTELLGTECCHCYLSCARRGHPRVMDGVVLVLLCLVVCVNGYGNGNVIGSCTDLRPGHNGNNPQTTTSPFTLTTDQTNYTVGQDIIGKA